MSVVGTRMVYSSSSGTGACSAPFVPAGAIGSASWPSGAAPFSRGAGFATSLAWASGSTSIDGLLQVRRLPTLAGALRRTIGRNEQRGDALPEDALPGE